jgi:hypothetical protein
VKIKTSGAMRCALRQAQDSLLHPTLTGICFVYDPQTDEYQCPVGTRLIWRFASVERDHLIHRYWSSDCPRCPIKEKCTPSQQRRVSRWEHEASLETMQKRLDRTPEAMKIRRQTVEHPFGTIKFWMGARHFLTRTLAIF